MNVNKIYKFFLILICIFFSYHSALSQNILFKNSNFKSNKQGLKDAKENISIADEIRIGGIKEVLLMNDVNEVFLSALHYYNKAQNFNPNNSDLNFKIGSCYLFTNQKENAYSYLLRAKELNNDISSEFYFYLGMSLQLNGKYDEALSSFQHFKNKAKKKVYENYSALVTKYIKECKEAYKILKIKNNVWIDNLSINTKFDEWSPCLSADGELMIFTSNKPNSNTPNKFGIYDQNIYSSNLEERNFHSSVPVSELNTSNNDVSGGLAFDGQRLLLFKNEEGNNDVYESVLKGVSWTKPIRKMGEKLRGGNTEKNETFASYHPADVKVYYITDGGYSDNKNIYFSGVMNRERNLWGQGQSAGHEINTKFQEGSVYIHADGRTMYFSSKGHNTLGGYDIFVSYLDELGHWGKPINLGYPINTPYDDLFYSATASGRYAYIASNRAGGKGGLDIYKVTYKGLSKPMSTDREDQLIASIAKPISDNTIAKPILVKEKSLTVFKGKVIDAVTKDPIFASIDIILNETGDVFTSFNSNSATGKFLLSLPSGADYGISVAAEGYLFHSENFNISKKDGFNSVNKDIELKNIEVGNNITLKNVFFDTGKWDVRSDSYSELERLVNLLSDVKSLKIEISGHTDNIGSESFNQSLSQRRADEVVNFLVSKGVNQNRLSAKGYGQSEPIESNNTTEGRALNRRTEFKILEN